MINLCGGMLAIGPGLDTIECRRTPVILLTKLPSLLQFKTCGVGMKHFAEVPAFAAMR